MVSTECTALRPCGVPHNLFLTDCRWSFREQSHILQRNRVKVHGTEQFPYLGSLTLPSCKSRDPQPSMRLAVNADQRRRKVTFDSFLQPIYHYANCCKPLLAPVLFDTSLSQFRIGCAECYMALRGSFTWRNNLRCSHSHTEFKLYQ